MSGNIFRSSPSFRPARPLGCQRPPKLSPARFFHTCALLFLLLFTTLIAPWPVLPPTVLAAGRSNPNPKLSPPPWLTPPTHGKPDTRMHTVPITRTSPPLHLTRRPGPWPVTMTPTTLTLTPQAQHFLSNDGRLEVSIPAGTVTTTQVQQAGGTITLTITQVLPGSGGLRNEHVFFGTYELQLHNASGKLLTTLVLAHPLTFRYHLLPSQQGFLVRGQIVYALWNSGDLASMLTGTPPVAPKKPAAGSTPTPTPTPPGKHHPTSLRTPSASPDATPSASVTPSVSPTPSSNSSSPSFHQLLNTTGDATGLVWSLTTSLSVKQQPGIVQTPSSITFGTQSPQALWGAAQDFQVDLNSGGLTYSYPLDLPAGPGGLTPSLALTYSSGSVNESHNVQAAAPWVGEGWNLSLGSISWAQENVTPGTTNHIESVWHISDPNGLSGQLIPPSLDTSTSYPLVPAPGSLPQPYLWHTAPESHTKINEKYMDPNGNQPCWQVWLPNGIKEEFGCTRDSRQSLVDGSHNQIFYRWDLDLMIDAHGNQVQITYKELIPKAYYVQDDVISTIAYDAPACHNTTSACTGSAWNPQVTVTFDSSDAVPNANLTNATCLNWTSSTSMRCDDPLDLSGSGGLPAPKIVSSYVLNDVQVQVGSSLNLLRKYVFSYEQTKPQTITDPATGQQESVSGFLDLTKIQAFGTDGNQSQPNATYPVVNVTYNAGYQHYLDYFQVPLPSTNCPPPSTGMPCDLWSQSYNARYINTLDNGRGWHETITWAEAHNNTQGVTSGHYADDPLACNGNAAPSNVCGSADDQSWSRWVVTQRTATSNGVTSTWQYTDYLQTHLSANFPGVPCSSCHQGFSWGNQNDADYADYYNGQFQSFSAVRVISPDSSYQYHTYGATTGWGSQKAASPVISPPVSPLPISRTTAPSSPLFWQVKKSWKMILLLTIKPCWLATAGPMASTVHLLASPTAPIVADRPIILAIRN